MSLHVQGIREEDGAAAYRRRLVKPFTRAVSAVLSLDHVVKSADHNGQCYALVSVHKGNELSCASFLIENVEAFGKCRRFVSHVFVVKDLPGELRRQCLPTKIPRKFYFATMVIYAATPYVPSLFALHAPKAEATAHDVQACGDDALTEKALAAVDAVTATGVEPSQRKVIAEICGRAAHARMALDRLVIAGLLLEENGSRSAVFYRRPKESESANATASQDQED